jgi:hypothetical protein
MLPCWMPYNYSTTPDPRGFLRFILGICLLTIVSGILFQNKAFVQFITQRSCLIIGSGHKDWFESYFWVFVGKVICFTIFSKNLSRKERFSNLLNQFAHVSHQIFTIILHAMILWIQNLGDLDSKARGLWDTYHQWLIFQNFGKIRTEDSRLNWPSAWFYEST